VKAISQPETGGSFARVLHVKVDTAQEEKHPTRRACIRRVPQFTPIDSHFLLPVAMVTLECAGSRSSWLPWVAVSSSRRSSARANQEWPGTWLICWVVASQGQ
jgi:hypothetical protein